MYVWAALCRKQMGGGFTVCVGVCACVCVQESEIQECQVKIDEMMNQVGPHTTASTSSSLSPSPPPSPSLSLPLPPSLSPLPEQKREQDGQLSDLKTKLEACTQSLSTVEAEKEQVTSRMEEIKVRIYNRLFFIVYMFLWYKGMRGLSSYTFLWYGWYMRGQSS